MECKPGGKGQSRFLYHGGRGKVHEYFQGAVKNSLAIFKMKELVETKAFKNYVYASSEENINNIGN